MTSATQYWFRHRDIPARPLRVTEHDWDLFLRHVVDRQPMARIARATGIPIRKVTNDIGMAYFYAVQVSLGEMCPQCGRPFGTVDT